MVLTNSSHIWHIIIISINLMNKIATKHHGIKISHKLQAWIVIPNQKNLKQKMQFPKHKKIASYKSTT
jgi:hypothetical protein